MAVGAAFTEQGSTFLHSHASPDSEDIPHASLFEFECMFEAVQLDRASAADLNRLLVVLPTFREEHLRADLRTEGVIHPL